MGFFNRVFASVGIDAAKVDTVVETENIFPGGEIEGYIEIKGGNVEQKIDKIYLNVFVQYLKEYTTEDQEGEETEEESKISVSIQKFDVHINRTVRKKENFEVPFSFILSAFAPISTKSFPIWIQTGLDIKRAIDPTDRDYINVAPHFFINSVIGALEELGFVIRQIENEYYDASYGKIPFVQEIEFEPTGAFRGQLEELEIIYFIKEDGISLIMEMDRKAKGFMGSLLSAMNLDEITRRLFISEEDLSEGNSFVANILQEFIENHI